MINIDLGAQRLLIFLSRQEMSELEGKIMTISFF